MNKNNGNGKLANDLIVAYDQRQTEILEKLGGIAAQLDSIQIDRKRETRELRDEIRKVKARLTTHIEDHQKNPDIMGAAPFLKKYTKKHWKIVLIALFAAQFAMAAMIAKYGVEKVIKVFEK